MERISRLLIAFGAVLLLFTGVASAETGIVVMQTDFTFYAELLDIIGSFITDLQSLFESSAS